MSVPVLETERLILRAHEPGDFAPSAAMWGNTLVVQHISGRPFTAEESWARLLRYAGHWSLLGFGYWALIEKTTGSFIGEVGFADYKRDITPAFDRAPEMGWVLVPSAQGRGFAQEAVTSALAWAQRHFGQSKVVCMIAPDNGPSLSLAAKHGFREYARTLYKGAHVILLETRLSCR